MSDSFMVKLEWVLEKICCGIFCISFLLSAVGAALLVMMFVRPETAYFLMDSFADFVLNNI